MSKKIKIKQIVPANPGWFAHFSLDDGAFVRESIAVWAAVINNDGSESVESYSGDELGVSLSSQSVNFAGCYYEPTLLSKL